MSLTRRLGAGVGGMLSTALLSVSMLRRGFTFGVRGVVLDADGAVLLVRHGYVPGWHLPGGGVEPGETAADALAKELREEANLELTGPAALHGIFLNRHPPGRDHVAVYVVRDFIRHGVRQPDWEIREARFFGLDALPEGTGRGTAERLAEVRSGRPPAAEW